MASGEFIEIVSQKALDDLTALNLKLTDTVSKVAEVNAMMGTLKTPSASNSSFDNLNKSLQNNVNTMNQLSVATRQHVVEKRILISQVDQEIKLNSSLVGSYQKLVIEQKNAVANAKNMAIEFGATSQQFKVAQASAMDLTKQLNAVNASMANSAPRNAFFEGISQIYSKVRVLAYILPGIGIGGIFGLAITPLMEYIRGLDLFKEKLNAVTETQKQFNAGFKETGAAAIMEQQKIKDLLAVAQDQTMSYNDRLIAVQKLQKEYPYYFGNLSKEEIMAGNTAKAEQELNDALIARAKMQAALNKITENASKILDLEFQLADERKKLNAETVNLSKSNDRLVKSRFATGDAAIFAAAADARAVNSTKDKIKELTNEKTELEKVNITLGEYAVANQKASIGLDFHTEKTKKDKEAKRERVEAIKSEVAESDGLLGKLEEQKKLFVDLQKAMSKNNEEWQQWQVYIDATQASIDTLTGKPTIFEKELQKSASDAIKQFQRIDNAAVNTTKAFAKVEKQTNHWLLSFSEALVGGAGFKGLDVFLSGQFKKMMADSLVPDSEKSKEKWVAYMEVAQDAINFVDKLSADKSQKQIESLTAEKDLALKFAGDDKAAQLKIEQEYAAKKREIDLKSFRHTQQLAMINIIIDTAQAVIASFKDDPFLGIPMSVIVAAVGAAQLAVVATQKPPAFALGTENAPKGLAYTDEHGAEIHTDKYGNIKDFGTDKGARLKFLEQGDVIYNALRTKEILQQNDFNSNLSNLISSNGIGSTLIINNGISASEMREIMFESVGSQPKIINKWDKDGFSSSVSRNGNVTKRAENRGSGIGISI